MNVRRMAASWVVAACALTVSLIAQAPASPSSPPDLAQELAQKIASVVAPLDQVRLSRANPDSRNAEDEAALLREIAGQLRARGLSLVTTPDGAARVRVACSENLRDRVCAAEIVKGDNRDVVAATRPRASNGGRPAPGLATLDVRPVLAQAEPVLDLVEIGGRLLVLDTAGVDIYQRGDTGWKLSETVPFVPAPAWPRDPRGRLSVNGDTAVAFLPGMTCRCTFDPLRADCTASRNAPWPVGVASSALAPTANYFTAPNAPPFFTAAPVTTDAGSGWLLAGLDGKLHLVGAGLQAPETIPGLGDDIAGVQTACGSGRQIIAAGSDGGDEAVDWLRAYEMGGGRLTPLTPQVRMPGRITAVWDIPAKGSVVVVAHNLDLNRYEAFYVGVACVR